LLFFIAFILSLSIADAQNVSEPVYLLHENTVWRWTESDGLQPIGEPIKNLSGITLSPSWDQFLVTTYHDEVRTLLEAECPCGGPAPDGREFWLMDAAAASGSWSPASQR
jgi:hypothetical protein